jgi:diaminopimelate epimerase
VETGTALTDLVVITGFSGSPAVRVIQGLAVSMGNPHLACLTDVAIDGLDLTGEPEFDAGLFPEGVNVELS